MGSWCLPGKWSCWRSSSGWTGWCKCTCWRILWQISDPSGRKRWSWIQKTCGSSGSDRTWIWKIPWSKQLSGNCYTLRRSWITSAASGTCNAETDGKRIWFRCGRWLEDSSYGSCNEDHDTGQERCKGNFLHGRLHIQPCTWKRRYPGSSYAGSLPDNRRWTDQHQVPAA